MDFKAIAERRRALRTGPASMTIALSREAGARGGTIARRVGRKLGWQVYDQELLEYMAQEAIVSQGVLDAPSATPADWTETRLQQLIREGIVSEHPTIVNLARVILALGAQGQAVLIGRGAGCLLPRETTLNVRIVAPLRERIAYMGQWLRLSEEEAAERVPHARRAPARIHRQQLPSRSFGHPSIRHYPQFECTR